MKDYFTHSLFPWVAYPIGIGIGVYLHLSMLSWGISLQLSTYVPIFFVAGAITLLELYFPYLQQWKPNIKDIKNDAMYMLIVQTILPKILAFLTALVVLRYSNESGLFNLNLWPHHFPVWIQAMLMILVADFFRYWLHVASHKNRFLWRFHAVHHSPKKLYWINTGRFHPIEEVAQFLLDALPFILLGVSEYVLAFYFVFYAINGFFQHSNIRLKFGVLSYLISTAELHRWHHSRLEKESNSNYGNNTIIWDLIFGTRYLPKDRNIEEIGLINSKYPTTFLDQLKTPFVGGLDKKYLPLPSIKQLLVNGLIKLQMTITKYTIWKPMLQAAKDPMHAQLSFLKQLVKENANTEFGKEHQFNKINSYEDYCRLVPIQSYESLSPYFTKQDKLKEASINSQQPFMYAVTSGTTGASKLIPILDKTVKQNKKHQKLFTYIQYRDNPGTFSGKMLGIVSPAIEGYTEPGTPFGSVSGVLYKNMPPIMKSKYVLPFEIFSIENYDLKYQLILRIALTYKDITYFVTANPSTLLLLNKILNEDISVLVNEIEQGGFREYETLPKNIQTFITKNLKPNSDRANELRQLILNKKEITFADVWPQLQTVVTWTGGSCGIAIDAVKQKLPAITKVIELGYMATEVRGTITIDAEKNLGLPTIQDNFFEFVERDDWENENHNFLTIDQLSKGKEYYIFITTGSGLYRYFINDIVRVNGKIENTPTLQFIQKGKGVTSITGEKLYECQVIESMKLTEKEFNFSNIFYMMLANKIHSNYELFIETPDNFEPPLDAIRDYIESCLCKLNIEYQSKLASGRLKPLSLYHIQSGTRESFKKFYIEKGQKESQFKIVALQYKDELEFDFDNFILEYFEKAS